MSDSIQLSVQLPEEVVCLQLPAGVQSRLDQLLDRQDAGELLSESERAEAQGLVDLVEFLSLLRLRSKRLPTAA